MRNLPHIEDFKAKCACRWCSPGNALFSHCRLDASYIYCYIRDCLCLYKPNSCAALITYTHMDTVSSTIATPASAAEGQEPAKKQFVGNHGRTPSPPLKNRVIVFNCRENTIGVENKKDFAKRKAPHTSMYDAKSDLRLQVQEPIRKSSSPLFGAKSLSLWIHRQNQHRLWTTRRRADIATLCLRRSTSTGWVPSTNCCGLRDSCKRYT